MVSTRSTISNADDTHANYSDANNNANANADDANDANANDADAADKAEVDPFPVLTCEECRRFIDIQRIIIRTLISEFWLEGGYTTPPSIVPLDVFTKPHLWTSSNWIT